MRKLQKRRKRKRAIASLLVVVCFISVLVLAFNGGAKIGEKMKYPVEYSGYITKYAHEYELDPYLVIAVIKQESNFIADAHSPYAGGLMQLTEITANEYAQKLGLDNFDYMDPKTNIQIGCFVLSSLIDKYKVCDTALAAYNAGVGNVDSWLENPDYSKDGRTLYKIPYSETRHYVERINNYRNEYKKRVSLD